MKLARIPAAASLLLLAACGSDGNAALSKQFNYGSPQSPTSSEQTAISSAESSVSDTAAFNSSADATKGATIVTLADDLASAALGASGFGIDPPSRAVTSRALRSASLDSACATVVPNKVTFTNCTDVSSGFSFTLSGTISSTADSVTWDVTGGFTGTDQGVTFNLSIHESGKLTVTATTVKGQALSSFGGTISGGGGSVSFGLDTAALVDLTYQTTPSSCVVSGTLELKRVWSQRPQGAGPADLPDVGVKITWSGCGTASVAHSQ